MAYQTQPLLKHLQVPRLPLLELQIRGFNIMWLVFFGIFVQVKNLARELYDCHFKAAESHPRDIVAKLHSIVQHIEQACELHSDLSKVRMPTNILSMVDLFL